MQSSIQERQEADDRGRRKRIPLGVPRNKLGLPEREGYVRRWIRDYRDRLQLAQEGGYQFIADPRVDAGEGVDRGTDGMSAYLRKVTGTGDDGRPEYSYAMEIRKDWYDADQAAKRAATRETEDLIRRGELNSPPGQHRYVPKEGIKIDV